MAKSKKKKRLAPKYKFRRVVLVFAALAVFGAGGWYASQQLLEIPAATQGEPADTEAPQDSNLLTGEIQDSGQMDLRRPASANSAGLNLETAADGVTAQAEQPAQAPNSTDKETVKPAAPNDSWQLLLVNPSNKLSEGFEVKELETVSTDGYQVDARIGDNVKRMFAKAKEDGVDLLICSAYRSVEKQETLYAQQIQQQKDLGHDEEKAAAVAGTIVAVPGTSEHHTGLAVDIVTPSYQVLDSGFADTVAFRWLSENAADFGFVMRYPANKENITKIIYEPWHYRYVGAEHAKKMNEMGYCLEEYLYWLENN